MNNQYTSLELSKKIQKAVPSVETERSWRWYITTEIRKETNIKPHIVDTPTSKHKYLGNAQHTPAYLFHDILSVIQVLGEESDLPPVVYSHPDIPKVVLRDTQHKLLDAYLADNLTIGKHTEDFITNLLEQ